jgi:hypothetical protein
VHTVRANDDALFMYSDAGRIWRAGLTPDQPPHDWFSCGQCVLDFEADNDFVYFLQATDLVRTSSADGPWSIDRPADRFETPFNHMSGAMAMDAEYVYSAVLGCGAVTRYHKPDMTPEVMEFSAPPVRDAGSSVLLTRPGGGIVCGHANAIVTADSWGGSTRTLAEVQGLWSLGVTEAAVYWAERKDGPAQIVMLPWETGTPERFGSTVDEGDLREGCILPGTEKFVLPQFRTAEVFDGESRTFSSFELGGRPHSFACTERGLYAAVAGTRERGPGYELVDEKAFWIAFIPMEAFED